MPKLLTPSVILMIVLLCSSGLSGRAIESSDPVTDLTPTFALSHPAHCMAAHHAGQIKLTVANNGTLGKGYSPAPPIDYFQGDSLESCLYPKDSAVEYLFGCALWIGAVVGEDTLVSVGADGWSVGAEMFPDEAPFGYMIRRSILDTADFDAISEEDLIAVYTDTTTEGVPPDYFGRPHQPLSVRVTQSSYAWSPPDADDFVIVEYEITNIGDDMLHETYVGWFMDGDVSHLSYPDPDGVTDDLTGFISTVEIDRHNCTYVDDVNLAWIADNDGDPGLEGWSEYSSRHVTGIAILSAPTNEPNVTYNWWASHGYSAFDFGPRQHQNDRDFQTGGTGTPEGDANKYFLMTNGEIDYDSYFTGTIGNANPEWMPPPEVIADDIADGFDTRFLLSVGPFEIEPGQTLPVVVAFVGGIALHTDPNNIDNLPHQPWQYHANLDFADIIDNVQWAQWIYDNPGVDTDSDGYSGEYVACQLGTMFDTLWYEGDWWPDYSVINLTGCELRGDFQHDGILDISDITGMASFMFQDGVPPVVFAEVDVTGDYALNIADLVMLAVYMFCDGPEPPVCGESMPVFKSRVPAGDRPVVWTEHDETGTVVWLQTGMELAGIEMRLRGDSRTRPVDLTEDAIDLIYGGTGNEIHLGLIDLDGPGVLPSGVAPLFHLEGRFEIGEARAADIFARDVALTIGAARTKGSLPTGFILNQNYPNPFNPSTEISFTLYQQDRVKLEVFNITGQRVATLVDARLEAGDHVATFDGHELASGVYLYRFETEGSAETRKMLLLK